jgi:hypothetical protein
MIPATVLLGSMAAGGLGLYLGGSTGAPSTGIAKTVEDSVSSIADQVTKTAENVTEYVSPKSDDPEPVTPPVQPVEQPVQPVVEEKPAEQPVEPVEPVEQPVEQPVVEEKPVEQPVVEEKPVEQPVVENRAVAPSLPEVDSMAGGQRGGFGRPTWAPLNSGTSLTQALGIVPGSTEGNLLATATGSKTPQQIQQELVAVDQEIRRLKTQEFLTNKTLTEESNLFGTIRADYTKQVNKRERSKNLLKIYERELASILEPKPATSDLKPEAFAKFPRNKADGTPKFTRKDKGGKEDIDDFDAWKKDAYTKASALPDGDPLKPFAGDDANKWWNKLSSGSGSTKKTSADELTKILDNKERETTDLENAEQEIYKLKFKFETKQKIVQDLRSKVREFIDKSQEAEKKKEELLKELSEYKVPQTFFDKKEVKSSILPTGEELNKLLAEYKAQQELIKQKQEEIDEEVGVQLENGSLKDTTNYDRLNGEKEELETQRQNIIDKIEGRAPAQVEQLKDNLFDSLVRELIKDKLTKQAGELLLKTNFPQVFKMYLDISKASADKIYDQVDKYYNFFKKGINSFNGQDVSRAFAFFYGLTKEPRLSSELKQKVTEFSQQNKQIIATAMVNLELALKDIKTPSIEDRSIVEQALMSGESVPWKTLKRAAVTVDVSHLFTKTVQQKLVILTDSFKERIFDKLRDVSVKYGLWGKTEISGYRQAIGSSFDQYKQLLLAEITSFTSISDTDAQKEEKQKQSIVKIRGLAILLITLLREGDTLIPLLESILSNSPELKGGAKMTVDEFKTKILAIKTDLEKPTEERILVIDGAKALFDQLVYAKTIIVKKNINLSFAIRKKESIDTQLTLANELLRAYDDLGKAFEALYVKQTTFNQAKKLLDDFKEYREAMTFLRNKIQQTYINEKKKPVPESSLKSIQEGFSKLGSILGSFLPDGSTAYSKAGSLAQYLLSGNIPEINIKSTFLSIVNWILRNRQTLNIDVTPQTEMSQDDKIRLQELINIFSALPPDIDSYEKLTKFDLGTIFKAIVDSGKTVESLQNFDKNVVDFKQQYEFLLDLIEEYSDQEKIPLSGGAQSAMDKEARRRRLKAKREAQAKEDARNMFNYKRSQYRSDVDEARKRSDYREKQLRGELPFDENQEQLLEERQEVTTSEGTPLGTLLQQLKKVLTSLTMVSESQGISSTDSTFKPGPQKPPFDDNEEEEEEGKEEEEEGKEEEVQPPSYEDCVTYVNSELTPEERRDTSTLTAARIQEISDSSGGNITVDQVKQCINGISLNVNPITGGNHTTRRHRVRGMPKRAKTRRTY